jgi:hypothetical protein
MTTSENLCPACSQPVHYGVLKCSHCDAPVDYLCPDCNQAVPFGTRECPDCRAHFDIEEPAEDRLVPDAQITPNPVNFGVLAAMVLLFIFGPTLGYFFFGAILYFLRMVA